MKKYRTKHFILVTAVAFIAGSMCVAMIGGVINASVGIQGTITASQATNNYSLEMDIMIDQGAKSRWNPQLAIDSNYIAHIAWLDQEDALNKNYTLRIRKTTGSINELNGWKSWDAPLDLESVNVSWSQGVFTSADVDSNGILHVLFANRTGANTVNVSVWNGTGTPEVIAEDLSESWTVLGVGGSLLLRAPTGKIMFDSDDNRHVAWNNGTHLFYQNNSGSSIETIDSDVLMGDFDMVQSQDGKIHFIYAKANSNNAADKEIHYLRRNLLGSLEGATQITTNTIEDTRPDAILDEGDSLLMAWSTNASTDYIINYQRGLVSSPTEISSMHGGHPIIGTGKNSSFNPKIALFGGNLHIFYTTSINYSGADEDPDLVWQYFPNPNVLAGNTLTLLSGGTDKDMSDLSYSVDVSGVDDMFVTFQSYNSSNYTNGRIRMAKMDYTNPLVSITSPSGVIDGDPSPTSVLENTDLQISFQISENDISDIDFYWDGKFTNLAPTARSHVVPAASLVLGEHTFLITVTDEVGNSYTFTGNLNVPGVNLLQIITFIVIAAAGGVFAIILLWWYKNKAKIQKRKLELKLGKGKEADEGWGDEDLEEETESDLDKDTKIDLKKVDM